MKKFPQYIKCRKSEQLFSYNGDGTYSDHAMKKYGSRLIVHRWHYDMFDKDDYIVIGNRPL